MRVPYYLVRIGGDNEKNNLVPHINGHIKNVEVQDFISGASQFTITLQDRDLDFLNTFDSGDNDPIFGIGRMVTIYQGWVIGGPGGTTPAGSNVDPDSFPEVRRKIVGFISSIEPDFPIDGNPTVVLKGYDIGLQALTGSENACFWEKPTLSEVIEEIAVKNNLYAKIGVTIEPGLQIADPGWARATDRNTFKFGKPAGWNDYEYLFNVSTSGYIYSDQYANQRRGYGSHAYFIVRGTVLYFYTQDWITFTGSRNATQAPLTQLGYRMKATPNRTEIFSFKPNVQSLTGGGLIRAASVDPKTGRITFASTVQPPKVDAEEPQKLVEDVQTVSEELSNMSSSARQDFVNSLIQKEISAKNSAHDKERETPGLKANSPAIGTLRDMERGISISRTKSKAVPKEQASRARTFTGKNTNDLATTVLNSQRHLVWSHEATCRVFGNVRLDVGMGIDIQGVGILFSGVWFVVEATHHTGDSYYVTLKLKRFWSFLGDLSPLDLRKVRRAEETEVQQAQSILYRDDDSRPKGFSQHAITGPGEVGKTRNSHLPPNGSGFPPVQPVFSAVCTDPSSTDEFTGE